MANKKAGGDAPPKKDEKPEAKNEGKGKTEEIFPTIDEIPRTASEIARDEAQLRAMMRKQRFKRRWPEVTKVAINTRPWRPPPPPQKPPPVIIDLPELKTRRWIPPYKRRRRLRPKCPRIPAEEMQFPLPESHKLKKIWHNFGQVNKNKMMLQGSIGCNSKRYSSTTCGAQTGCIAIVCRGLLEEKTAAMLRRSDVDELIEVGDRFYKECMHALKCYKGNPQLQLHQLLTSFFLHDTKYTFKTQEVDKGILAKHPDNLKAEQDLMNLMEKRIGSTYMMILSIANTRHFLIWGHPPDPGAGSACKTVCYIFDPHMLDETGGVDKLSGAGAFLRYAGVTSFVVDFLSNYGDMAEAKKGHPKPGITLTNIEIVQQERLIRHPTYALDLKALHQHCFSEWDSMHINALIDKKHDGQYPLTSLSMVSLATSRANSKKRVRDFYQKIPKEPNPTLPIQPEKAPVNPSPDQIMALKGEDFFLRCPKFDGHTYGRDDLVPLPKSETILHSPVDVADQNFNSQYHQLDGSKWILKGTRHMASYRYQTFKHFTGIPCCIAALGMLHRYKARAWNEDTVDETLDLGYNLYRESLMDRKGPIRYLTLGEMKDTFKIRDREYKQKSRNIAVWGRLMSSDSKVFDLCRGLDAFFKEADSGILQVPGEYETAVWNEGGRYYLYHPWPACASGYRIGLRDGGKACILYFNRLTDLCDHFMESCSAIKNKPFSISDVQVTERRHGTELPEAVNKMKPVAPGRWIVRGSFHEADARFPEEHRGKQATPVSVVALAMAHVVDPAEWTTEDVDETLIRGDMLYGSTMEHLERMGISLETPKGEEELGDEEEEGSLSAGALAAADVLNTFKVSDFDCIETEVMDSAYAGSLNPTLLNVLKNFFREHSYGVFTARGASSAIFKKDGVFYFFDPHGCDENGLPSGEPRATACLIRIKGNVEELAKVIQSSLPPGSDDSFNISPVSVSHAKLNPEIGAPETKLESKAFEWISKGTAAIMMGPRGENSAIGKVATKAGIGDDDMAGRTIGLPAAAAFVAASVSVPPPHMHQDHMFNFLEAGADYYLNFYKKTGRKELKPEDLTEKFEMGVNTFSIELDEPVRLPLRLPDEPPPEGEEEGGGDAGMGEEEEPETMKQIKDLLFKMWYDMTKPVSTSLLVGDYHQLGLWMKPGGKVVAFDPAPTLHKGILTLPRITKGDELRLQRIKDEMSTEGEDEAAEEEDEAGGEGEEKPEPEPQFVPTESCPVLIVAASPGEFIDKLTIQGGLDKKQCLGPYWLYNVKVINELTASLKERKPAPPKSAEEGEDEADEGDLLVPALDPEGGAIGKYMTRMSRTVASVRGRVSQGEAYFMDSPNRNNQDAANSVMGIVVTHIEPYQFWKPDLIDGILKYGDRLYTLSLPKAASPPTLRVSEIQPQFHVTSFNVKLEIEDCVVQGDVKAGDTGGVLNLTRGINKFFTEYKHGVLCSKAYCVAIWKGLDDVSVLLWEPHAVGPMGKSSPAGAASAILYSTVDELAAILKSSFEALGVDRPGDNKFCISSVKVFWEFSQMPDQVTAQGAIPDEGYEWKVLTAYVETARGRTILRGSRPMDLTKFTRDAVLQSSAAAIVAAAMSRVRRPPLWTRRTVDEVMSSATQLFSDSLGSLGYEFRPGEDVLLPLQVIKRFVLGVNYVRYDLQEVFSGKLEQREPTAVTLRSALERFFESYTHGVLWSVPHAVAVWRVAGSPAFYMMEPHACGPTGLRIDAVEDGAACVLTFTSAKLMAYAYLQNTPVVERPRHEFRLYCMSMVVQPIKKLGAVDPPIVRQLHAPPGITLVPATSKVGIDGHKRRASEKDRKHPPGDPTCQDAQRATEKADKDVSRLKGTRNASGWLVLNDGTQFMSACHSMACKKFPYASRGNQALACSVMAIAMSRVDDVCRWCSLTLDQILESGDQLYQDSYLHFKPPTPILAIAQVLRKFYTPGNCVCRVVVYKPRHEGKVDSDLIDKMTEFFNEEKSGVFVAGKGDFSVALFKTPRGFYMFDPADRDRYGRAVAPPCIGRARACFSQYPNVETLCQKLGPNIPPVVNEEAAELKSNKSKETLKDKTEESKEVRFEEPASFSIYGMDVTSLRRLNKHER